ncbi:MAG TPA: hypothetical protein VM123_12870, partial [archaeon]|nr:hypothetical protein [archaeon]
RSVWLSAGTSLSAPAGITTTGAGKNAFFQSRKNYSEHFTRQGGLICPPCRALSGQPQAHQACISD